MGTVPHFPPHLPPSADLRGQVGQEGDVHLLTLGSQVPVQQIQGACRVEDGRFVLLGVGHRKESALGPLQASCWAWAPRPGYQAADPACSKHWACSVTSPASMAPWDTIKRREQFLQGQGRGGDPRSPRGSLLLTNMWRCRAQTSPTAPFCSGPHTTSTVLCFRERVCKGNTWQGAQQRQRHDVWNSSLFRWGN